MKKLAAENEFYVGYLPIAPKGIASVVRKVIAFLILSMIIIAGLLAWQQKKFSSHRFEYGSTTLVEGYIFSKPVAHILIPVGTNHDSEELYQTVLLVGIGKRGAGKVIEELSITEGQHVTLNGFLFYGDGKTLLQVNDENNMKLLDGKRIKVESNFKTSRQTISGEVVDPKCYFGVMKPGEGKAHRSCAIRCIAGGIPPVFRTDTSGYMLIVGPHNEPISTEIADIVGDQITLTGTTVQWNDWTLFQLNDQSIRNLVIEKRLKENLVAFETGMTLCGN